MIRQLVLFTLSVAATLSSVQADHFYYAPRPVVFAAPVVAYQPAYVVPTATYAVTQYPVTTVSYGTSYFAPVVPVSAYYAPVVYSQPYVVPVYSTPVYAAPFYAAPVYAAPYYAGYQSVHGRLHVHRYGGYNYHLRVRGW